MRRRRGRQKAQDSTHPRQEWLYDEDQGLANSAGGDGGECRDGDSEFSVDSSCLGQDCGIALNHYSKNADTLYPAR